MPAPRLAGRPARPERPAHAARAAPDPPGRGPAGRGGRPLHAEGLNAAGWDLLLTLYRSAPPEGLSPGQLSELSAVSGPSTTNRVARLQARGLVTRRTDDRDRRSARITLTPAGRAAVDRLLPGHLHRETRALAALTPAELDTLDRLAARLLGALEGGSGQ
ncbi:MarR family winged helix-turn-helix transcriptional regulator [Deinococcus aquaticus]|uniref:MarR family winged helix-turn-helix transcriptional regulator n=1 Tax=Deinococcus aquaticus TaxID=328692 RepID=UPI00361CF1A6